MKINPQYNDDFKNHIAKHTIYEDGNEMLSFKDKGGSNINSIIFSKVEDYFNVNGDLGDASFTWFNSNLTFEWIATRSDNSYIHSKMQSSELGRSMTSYTGKTCIEDVLTYFKENEDFVLDEDEFCDWKNYTEDKFEWISFLRKNGEKFFKDPDYWEYAYDFGFKIEERFYMWLDALKRAVTQINENKISLKE